ncbi:MAG: type II secretion system F family protein, partial [Clostridiales bacterium]|nr:type II secretion system F family protein [Clostridiales bacterium]
MASYKYEVISANGKIEKGALEADNLEMAQAALKAQGNTIVNLAVGNALNKDLDIHIGKAVSSREMSVFCR